MSNNYALALTVGIKNMFSQEADRLRNDFTRLESSNRSLQQSIADIEAYEKAQTELARLSTSSNATTDDLQRQEQEITRLSRALRDAGIDTNELTRDQSRLEDQLNDTTIAAKKLATTGDSLSTFSAAAGGLTVATALAITGHNVNELERNAAARTGKPLHEIQGSRDGRLSVAHDTDMSDEQVINMQVQAEHAGYKGNDAFDVMRTTAQLASVFKELDLTEVMAAQIRMMKSFDIDAERAGNLLTTLAQKSGDDQSDMLATMIEYSSMLSSVLDAETFIATLITGRQSGSFNYDKIADGLKESFQAKLSDPDAFKALVGGGETKGSLDELLKDPEQALAMKNALYQFRGAHSNSENAAPAYALIMTELARIYQTDRRAARNVAEGIGGSIMAEELGIEQISAMALALQNPLKVLGDTSGALAKAVEQNLTPLTQLQHSLMSVIGAMSTVFIDIENAAEPTLDSISDLLHASADAMNNNTALAGVASVTAIGVVGAASIVAAKGAANLGRSIMGRPPESADESEEDRNRRRTRNASKVKYGAGALMVLAGGVSATNSLIEGDIEGAAGGIGMAAGGIAGMKVGAAVGSLSGPIGIAIGGTIGSFIGAVMGEDAFSGIAADIVDLFDSSDSDYVENIISKIENKEHGETSLDSTRQTHISMPLTISVTAESGATVPDDLEDMLNTILRERSPELMQQLREILNSIDDE